MGCPAHTRIAHRPGESFALVQPLDPLPEGIDLLLQGVEPRLQGQFDPGDVAPRNRAGFNFWISGPKKNGQDRHWAGSGPVEIDPGVTEKYWKDIRGCEPAKALRRE